MIERLRRNRKNPFIRALLAEVRLSSSDFVIPLFVQQGLKDKKAIPALPHNFVHSLDTLEEEVKALVSQGVGCFLLFPVIEDAFKDEMGTFALSEDNILYQAIRRLKKNVPEAVLMADVALDPYTSHGHDGIVDEAGHVLNDPTVEALVELSLKLAGVGIDYVAPSDMMDGRVLKIREALDEKGFIDTGILSYCAKFASSLYGPFREAVGSSLKFGDKKGYQLSYAGTKEALLESLVDIDEGADLLLVKPSTLYMDILSKIAGLSYRPVGAYHVSGEYAMACALSEKGHLNLEAYLLETFTSLKRAGAQYIITYGYPLISKQLKVATKG